MLIGLTSLLIVCIGVIVHRQFALENCQNDLYGLREAKGKCAVYEEHLKDTALATVKNVEFLMKEIQDHKTQAVENADKKEKQLREMHQLIHNITIFVAEKEKYKVMWEKCVDDLEDIKTRTIPSSNKN